MIDCLVSHRIGDLELAVDRMKQQQENLHKRLKDESDRKVKLEVRNATNNSAYKPSYWVLYK